MYIKPSPIGTNQPLAEDRKPIWRAVAGDALYLTTYATRHDGVPVTYENSRLLLELAETRFSTVPIWSGSWRDGIEMVNTVQSGLIQVRIPDSISDTLRRGSYTFSLAVSDRLDNDTHTAMVGTLLIEYEATSPQHNVPYNSPPTTGA